MWEKIVRENSNHMKTDMAILLMVKGGVKEEVTENKRNFIIIRRSVPQEKYIVLNVYAPNNITSKFMKQKIDRTVWERQIQNQSWRF